VKQRVHLAILTTYLGRGYTTGPDPLTSKITTVYRLPLSEPRWTVRVQDPKMDPVLLEEMVVGYVHAYSFIHG
jgi:hypothetical protein